MSSFCFESIIRNADIAPNSLALCYKDKVLTYQQLRDEVGRFCSLLSDLGIQEGDRVGIYLPKQIETVVAIFACNYLGAVFVPINPTLKAKQLAYIVEHCQIKLCITNTQRRPQLENLDTHVLSSDGEEENALATLLAQHRPVFPQHEPADEALAAIFYTSGSTGQPKGVMISNANLKAGAKSVSQYLENNAEDRLLAVLPLSFDYGLSQLTTAFYSGACVVLLEYLLPKDVIKACERYQITGLAAVPALWIKLAKLTWPDKVVKQLRYWTNSGGAMPLQTLKALREALPSSKAYLMYGLTEAFRSSYLAPKKVDRKPLSVGQAIPDASIWVLNENGEPCEAFEHGELVHFGPHVAMGYWNDPERTSKRFKTLPQNGELAVFSGDKVYFDDEGDLFFVSRMDEMIKSSGYRISPLEIEEPIYASGQVEEVMVCGVKDDELGQKIVAVLVLSGSGSLGQIRRFLQKSLPTYMQVHHFVIKEALVKNNNGKIDRALISSAVQNAHKDYQYAQE